MILQLIEESPTIDLLKDLKQGLDTEFKVKTHELKVSGVQSVVWADGFEQLRQVQNRVFTCKRPSSKRHQVLREKGINLEKQEMLELDQEMLPERLNTCNRIRSEMETALRELLDTADTVPFTMANVKGLERSD